MKLVMKIALGIIVAVVLLMVGCSALIASDPEVRKATEALDNATTPEPTKSTEPTKPGETAAQKNARRSAESYIDMSGFSRSGLIKQLKFEGYSLADATYAVGAITVDWNKQAARSAESYIDMSGFSRSGLIEQLKFEGYSQAQAAYGANAVGL